MQITRENILKLVPKNKYTELLPVLKSSLKEEKTQVFATLAFTLVALSFFGLFAINPTLSTIAQLQKELSDAQFIDKKLEEKIINLRLLQQQYTTLGDDIPTIIGTIPHHPEAPLLTGQIRALTQKNGLTLSRLQVFQVELAPPVQDNKEPLSFVFSLEVQGSYDNIVKFLDSLTNFSRVVTLDNLSLTQPLEGNNLQLNIRGKAYFK